MDTAKYKNYTDKELKDQGNKQFAARNFDGAIDSYTLAIIKNSNVPHYYTNRALCYLNQKRWPQAVQDARQALEKDPNLVKGHFYLGKALFERESLDEAIEHLYKAHDLAKEQGLNFGDEISLTLRLAKKKRWDMKEEKELYKTLNSKHISVG